VPFAKQRYQAFLPLMPLAFEQFDMRDYDVVISTSSACAKGVIVSPGALHLCYCYTPCRYIWDLYHDYTRSLRMRPLAAYVAHRLRIWDRLTADRVDHFVGISHEVAARIRRHYRREAEVIYPPVDVERFSPSGDPPEEFYLVVSRLVPYKRIDLAIEAAGRLGRRLIVVGDGPERRRLERMAGADVEFRGHVSDEEAGELLTRCRAMLFPGLEDFGIAPLEAQAAGRPVIAYGRGAALETVVRDVTGVFFPEQTAEALAEAIRRSEEISFDWRACRANAERFRAEEFRKRIRLAVERNWRGGEWTGAVEDARPRAVRLDSPPIPATVRGTGV
jgi:glycosyltransferase involved in cell wall biosynthesis